MAILKPYLRAMGTERANGRSKSVLLRKFITVSSVIGKRGGYGARLEGVWLNVRRNRARV
jgi:hypothetical protein